MHLDHFCLFQLICALCVCSTPTNTSYLPVRRSLEFYDACLYEAVMACDSDCVLGGGELIVRIPRDAYKDYPSSIIGSECGQWKE